MYQYMYSTVQAVLSQTFLV